MHNQLTTEHPEDNRGTGVSTTKKTLFIIFSILLSIVVVFILSQFVGDYILGRQYWNFIYSLPNNMLETLIPLIFWAIIFGILSIFFFKAMKKISVVQSTTAKVLVLIIVISLLGIFFYPKPVKKQLAECYGVPTGAWGSGPCFGVVIGNNKSWSSVPEAKIE